MGWSSTGEYAAVLLTVRAQPELRFVAVDANCESPSAQPRYWDDPTLGALGQLLSAGKAGNLPMLAGGTAHMGLAGSGIVEHTPAGEAGTGAGGWASGVALPPEEMAWRPTQADRYGYRRMSPFPKSFLLFATPRSITTGDWPTLRLSDVCRPDCAELRAQYTLRARLPTGGQR